MHKYFFILPVLNIALCAGLGLFTFSRNPRHHANIGFALGMLSLAVSEAGSALVMLFDGEGALTGMRISLIGQAMMPPAWLYFSIVFARANYREVLLRRAYIIFGALIISAGFAVWLASSRFAALSPVQESLFSGQAAPFIISPAGKYFYIYLILGLVLSLVNLENTLRSSGGTKRWQIKYIIFGIGAVLAFFIYLYSQILLFSVVRTESMPLASSVIMISALMMAVFIVRHRLMEVDVFISRYVIYNSLTVLVVGLYLLIVGIAAESIKYFNIRFNYFFTALFVFVSVLALFLLLFTSSLRRKAQLFINRNFYKHKYEFRDKWMETVERISSRMTAQEIQKTLVEMISETTGAKKALLWLYDSNLRRYLTAADISEPFKSIKPAHPIIDLINANSGPFMIDSVKDDIKNQSRIVELEALKNETKAVLCSPLMSGREVAGFILQTEDMSGQPYGRDDFELLNAMCAQAAMQLKNIRLAGELAEAKEVEAFNRLSAFVMHDLKNLTNSLSLVSQNSKHMDNPEFQKDAVRTIDSTVMRMKKVIEGLSTLPKGLEIKKEDVNLASIVHNAINKVPASSDKDIVITNGIDSIFPVKVDPEAIEMVILNIILNARDAIMKEGRITVDASLTGGDAVLAISDNGGGIPREFIEKDLFRPFKTTKKNGLGIGLYQCKAIIEAHGGSIEVESEEGRGTTFKVLLPSDLAK